MIDPMYRDKGFYKTAVNGEKTREHFLWQNMRARCYKNTVHKNYGTYLGCTVDEEFYSFQRFCRWAVKQIGFHEGYQLDKDLLMKGNLIYAPDRCVFVPNAINSLTHKNKHARGMLPIGVRKKAGQTIRPFSACFMRGQKSTTVGSYRTPEEAFYAYKKAKEDFIKEIANLYKEKIDPRAFSALMEYEVNIDD